MKFFAPKQNKIITALIAVLITTSLGSVVLFYPKNDAAAQAVPTVEVIGSPLLLSINTPGTAAAAIAAAKKVAGGTCDTILKTLSTSDKVNTIIDTSSQSMLSIIGGGIGESTQLSKNIVKAVAAQQCVDIYVKALGDTPSSTLTMGQDLQREQDKYTKVTESLRKIIEDLKARQNASVKDVLKAFMVKLVLNLNKNLTTKLVNSMVQKYKINDYLAYGNALATQVYSMKYINDNYAGDARTQMMLRSAIQSDKFPAKMQTVVAFATTKAQDYLGSQCNGVGALDANDSNSLRCLAAYGSEFSSPNFQLQNAQDQAQRVKAAGQQSAQAEIAQSAGFAPPRDCSGSIAQQNQIDQKYDSATTELVAASGVLAKLQTALANKQTTQAEVDKAQAAFDAVDKKYKSLPQEDPAPIIDICKAIDSPASFLGAQLNDFVKQHLDQGSQLQSDNLPFYATFLSDVASNFLTNLLTGGKSTSQVFKEAGTQALTGAATDLAKQLPTASSINLPPPSDTTTPITYKASNGPLMSYSIGLDSNRTPYYIITVNVAGNFIDSQSGNSAAASYHLDGPNIGGHGINQLDEATKLFQVYNIVAPSPSSYSITVYDTEGNVLRSATMVVDEKSDNGTVAGAITSIFGPRRSLFLPRG